MGKRRSVGRRKYRKEGDEWGITEGGIGASNKEEEREQRGKR